MNIQRYFTGRLMTTAEKKADEIEDYDGDLFLLDKDDTGVDFAEENCGLGKKAPSS